MRAISGCYTDVFEISTPTGHRSIIVVGSIRVGIKSSKTEKGIEVEGEIASAGVRFIVSLCDDCFPRYAVLNRQ